MRYPYDRGCARNHSSAVLGGGLGINLGGISVVAGTDFFSYTADFSEDGQQTSSKTKQLDMQIRLGLGFGH